MPHQSDHKDKIPRDDRIRKTALRIGGLLIALLLLEGFSLLALSLLPRVSDMEVRTTRTILREQQELSLRLLEEPGLREELHPVLGWVYRSGYSSASDRVNSVGARSLREYEREPLEGTRRVAAYGDSFMYGTEVSVEDAWSTVLEAITPSTEVLNFGVGGYGTDQAFLRYVEGRGAHGEDLVLIGFAPVNLRRSVNVYRRFISDRDSPLVKPRFVVGDEGLVLVPNPLPPPDEYRRLAEEPRATVRELGRHDSWYNPLVWENSLYDLSPTVRLVTYLGSRVYRARLSKGRLLRDGAFNPASEAFMVQRMVLQAFHDSVSATGAQPQLVIFPDPTSIRRQIEGKPSIYAPLIAALREDGVEVLDLVDAFAKTAAREGLGGLFASGGHYSAAGNRIVAEEVSSVLPWGSPGERGDR